MDPMETLDEPLKLHLATDQVRRGRQPFEIVGFQGSRFICAEEGVIGVMPRATRVRFAACAKTVQHVVGRLVHRPSPLLELFACCP
jgi:hypothetical protein